jgi:hypothetical protein
MHWTIFYDKAIGYVRASQRGAFTTEEQEAFLADIFDSPFWKPGLPLLIDYGSMPVDNIMNRELESTSSQLEKLGEKLGSSKLALLCVTDLQFGLGRQFQIMCMGRLDGEIRVFRDEDAAADWLLSEQALSSQK